MKAEELEAELSHEHPAAFAWALRCCGGRREEAEDVLQVAYERILDGRARFDGRSRFRTWLFGVVRRTALEQRRRSWLRLLRLRNWFEGNQQGAGGDPCDALLDDEQADRLRAALARLSPRQGALLHLVFYQELSVQEAAAVLRIPVGTARTHYERGKARLRTLLGEDPR